MHPVGTELCRFSPCKSDDLIERYRLSGLAEDFEQIVRRFAALVLCECRRVTGNVYDAEDASQLVFLALAMEIKSGTQILAPGAWLDNGGLATALAVIVPAAVVSAMVRSAQRLASPASANVPMTMTGMLHAIATVAVHRPLRFAAVAAAAMALGGSGMAVVEQAGAPPQLNPLSALRWLHRFA